jgi:hypothetical protein
MRSVEDTLIARAAGLEGRIAALETNEYAATAGDADTLDGLDAATSGADAHVLATDASGNVRIDGQRWIRGTGCGVIEFVTCKNLVDTETTSVIRITTTDETGDADAGHWSAFVKATPFNGRASTALYMASKGFQAVVTRSVNKGGTGANSAVTEVVETASAAPTSAQRDVGAVTMTVNEVDEYNTDIEFNVTHSGSSTANLGVTVFLTLVWTAFATPPTVAAV